MILIFHVPPLARGHYVIVYTGSPEKSLKYKKIGSSGTAKLDKLFEFPL